MKLLIFDTLLSSVIFPFVFQVLRDLRDWVHVPVADSADANAARISIVVPARNEERSIERCLQSLLDQRYSPERFEIVAIDDRSMDHTPSILARLAGEDSRLRVVQGGPLPNGWLGKCWALHQGVQAAWPDSDFLLFTDADTVHDARMLASVARFATEQGTDLLSLGTGQELGTAAERWLLPTIFGLILTGNGTICQANDSALTRIGKANGQFLLFRRQAYHAIGGHETVRGEMVEDFSFARRVKGTGLRLVFADGRHLVRTRMYRSMSEIWEGFSKNAFAETRRQPGGAPAALARMAFGTLGPYAALWASVTRLALGQGGVWNRWLAAQSALQAGALLALGAACARATGLPLKYGLAQPASTTFLCGVLANSTWRVLSGRGVSWKGRIYGGSGGRGRRTGAGTVRTPPTKQP